MTPHWEVSSKRTDWWLSQAQGPSKLQVPSHQTYCNLIYSYFQLRRIMLHDRHTCLRRNYAVFSDLSSVCSWRIIASHVSCPLHLLEACLPTQRGFQFWSLSCFWSHRSYYYSQFLCLYRWFERVKSWLWGQLQMEIFVLLISAFGGIVWNLFIGMCILPGSGEIF